MFKLKDEARLEYIVEKPAEADTPSLLASYGRYLVTPEIFEHLDPANIGLDNELWTVDAITKMAHSGDVIVCPTSGNWQTTGDPKNYFLAHQQYVLDNTSYADEVRRGAQR